MKKILIPFVLIFVVIVVIVILWLSLESKKEKGVVIITDKKEYPVGSILRLNIENVSKKKICFSSCYPYYPEIKEGEWKGYEFGKCDKPDLAEKCIIPKGIKGFELSLVWAENGRHRLAIPVCNNCREGAEFREEKRFYSNDFEIK